MGLLLSMLDMQCVCVCVCVILQDSSSLRCSSLEISFDSVSIIKPRSAALHSDSPPPCFGFGISTSHHEGGKRTDWPSSKHRWLGRSQHHMFLKQAKLRKLQMQQGSQRTPNELLLFYISYNSKSSTEGLSAFPSPFQHRRHETSWNIFRPFRWRFVSQKSPVCPEVFVDASRRDLRKSSTLPGRPPAWCPCCRLRCSC